jgi:predicted transcriptional regulator
MFMRLDRVSLSEREQAYYVRGCYRYIYRTDGATIEKQMCRI